jgi:hypothetical protein
MPKSGSTFLALAMSKLTGFPYITLARGTERNDQNLYLPYLIDSYSTSTITNSHVRATSPNIELIQQFNVRPVVMVRNIFDIVVSIRDHFHGEGFAFPTIYCNEKFKEMDEESQFDFIIELGIPWYFNFYVSWYEVKNRNLIDTLWISYEEAIEDWNATLNKIAEFYGISKSEKEITRALNTTLKKKKKDIRFNKGVAGRGITALSDEQKEKIVNFARFYPWVDFSSIGLKQYSYVE